MTMHNEQRAERLCDIIVCEGLREGAKLRCTDDLDSHKNGRTSLEGLCVTYRGLHWNARRGGAVAEFTADELGYGFAIGPLENVYFVRVEERPPPPTPTKPPPQAPAETALPGRIRSAVADLNALLNHAAQAGLEVRIAERETTTIGDGSARVTVEADILKRL